ncbi:MAG: hypothetical protein EBT68_05395, partial [Verrucomicrobia bacterium]|nr:hypothetical protein [Verrucomicrobiota bacterium]
MFSTASMASNALNPDSTLTNQSVVQVDLPGNYRSSISNFLSNLGTNFSANFPFGANNPAFTNLITLGGATSPPVAWVPIYSLQKVKGTTNWSNLPAARFAFFVEDMEGLIDVERMGGQTNRASGTNALEISLSNAVGSTMTNKVATLTNPANRPVYFSPGMIVSKGGLSTNDLRYITTGIQSWKSGNPTDGWFLTIPYGLAARTNPAGGYTNALAKKILINTSAVNVDSLATLLSNNLPHFGQRAGGLTNNNRFDYYKCIAANIVDYIDANQTPSIQTGAGGYRGTEALPLVSEVAMSIHWTNQLKNGVQYQEEFEVVHVVELWNMFNKAFNGTVNFGYDSSLTAQVGLTPSFSLNSATYRTSGQLTNAYNVSLQPNEFRAYASPPIRYRVLSGLGTEPKYGGGLTASNNGFLTFGRPGSPGANNYSSGWTLSSSAGLVYDKTTAIEEPTFTARCEKFTTGANTNPDFKNHQPALRLDPPNATGEVLFGTGDLRITYFTTNNVNPNATGIFNASTFADSGSLGYRNTIWAYTVRKGSTNRPDLWLDGGHANSSSQKWGQDVRVYTPGGAVNGAFAPALAAHPPSAAIQQEAPAYIADAQMTNIFELGRIFDPMQWKTAVPMTPAVPQATNPTNITSTSIADFQQGGGNTLRVGRAEHQRFAFSDRFGTDPVPFLGQSAVSLLDLFTVMDPTTGESAGRININTAPRAVLAALAGGISLTNDPAMAMAPVNDTMINAFTQGV